MCVKIDNNDLKWWINEVNKADLSVELCDGTRTLQIKENARFDNYFYNKKTLNDYLERDFDTKRAESYVVFVFYDNEFYLYVRFVNNVEVIYNYNNNCFNKLYEHTSHAKSIARLPILSTYCPTLDVYMDEDIRLLERLKQKNGWGRRL